MIPGSVVVVRFDGVTGSKTRPAVVVSTEKYNTERSDAIVALITSQIHKANSFSDVILSSWAEAGLDRPSAIRCFLQTYPIREMRQIGTLSETDRKALQERLRLAIDY